MSKITQSEPTRQELLHLWFRRNGIRQREIAARLGMSETCFCRLLRKDSISTWRHQQLLALGLPPELLPQARDIAPGPRRRQECSQALPA